MNKKVLIIILIVFCGLTFGVGGYFYFSKKETVEEPAKTEVEDETKDENNLSDNWTNEQVVISGAYADAEVVKLDSGQLRMYYSLEPEAEGFEGQIYSAVSEDGYNWEEEDGIRMKWATFPSVVKMEDGGWRMYFQGSLENYPSQNGILSATSQDGLSWTKEEGFRIKLGQQGTYDMKNVAAPAVERLSDDTFVMVYRGSAGESKKGQIDDFTGRPRPIDYLIFAASEDGLVWQAKSVFVDSANEKMREQIDGPDIVLVGDKIKLFCNSYEGVYILEIDKEGSVIEEERVVIKSSGPEHAPSDVTVINYNNVWLMYYGLHTKGVHVVENK